MHEPIVNREYVDGLCQQLTHLSTPLGRAASKALISYFREYIAMRDEVIAMREWREELIRKCNEAGAPMGIPIWEAYRKAIRDR